MGRKPHRPRRGDKFCDQTTHGNGYILDVIWGDQEVLVKFYSGVSQAYTFDELHDARYMEALGYLIEDPYHIGSMKPKEKA
jgi:hypothetical protein